MHLPIVQPQQLDKFRSRRVPQKMILDIGLKLCFMNYRSAGIRVGWFETIVQCNFLTQKLNAKCFVLYCLGTSLLNISYGDKKFWCNFVAFLKMDSGGRWRFYKGARSQSKILQILADRFLHSITLSWDGRVLTSFTSAAVIFLLLGSHHCAMHLFLHCACFLNLTVQCAMHVSFLPVATNYVVNYPTISRRPPFAG